MRTRIGSPSACSPSPTSPGAPVPAKDAPSPGAAKYLRVISVTTHAAWAVPKRAKYPPGKQQAGRCAQPPGRSSGLLLGGRHLVGLERSVGVIDRNDQPPQGGLLFLLVRVHDQREGSRSARGERREVSARDGRAER